MDKRYSVANMANDLRNHYMSQGLEQTNPFFSKSDEEIVMGFLHQQQPDVRDDIIRKMDSYGASPVKAFGDIDWTGPLATAIQAYHITKNPMTTNLATYQKEYADGIFKPLEPKNSVKTKSHGLFQINDFYQNADQQKNVWGKFVPPSEMTPEQNIEYASKLSKKEGWKRWSTYKQGLHKPHLGMSNEEISSTYNIGTDYLEFMDSMFGEQSDTAKAVMIAESSGNVDSLEEINVPSPTIKPAYKSNSIELPNGKRLSSNLAGLLNIDIENYNQNIKDIDDSDVSKNKIKQLDYDEDQLKEKGETFEDNIVFNDTRIKKDLLQSIGINSFFTEQDLMEQDTFSPENVRINLSPKERLSTLYNSDNFVTSVGSMLGKDLSMSGLEDYKKALILEREDKIANDPDLLARSLYLQDRAEFDTLDDLWRGDNFKYMADLAIQSIPSMLGTVVGIVNTLTVKSPTVYALTGSYMFAQQAGGSFDEVMNDLMEKEVADGVMSKEEAYSAATGAWMATGAINTFLEQVRVNQLAKMFNVKVPNSEVAKGFFNKIKRYTTTGKKGFISDAFQIPKQGIIEGVEELFQGMNERYQNNVATGQYRPEQKWNNDLLNEGQMVAEFLGGMGGGSAFGLAGGVGRANTRRKHLKEANEFLSKEIYDETDQQIDKSQGQNFNEGVEIGAESVKRAGTKEYFENQSVESFLKEAVSGTFNAKIFKGATNNKNWISSLLSKFANKPNIHPGQAILTVLADSKNEDGIKVLDKITPDTKKQVMSLMRARIKELIPALQAKGALSETDKNAKLDKIIEGIVRGDVKLPTTRIEGVKELGQDTDKKVGRFAYTNETGKGLVESLIIDLIDSASSVIKNTSSQSESGIQREIANVSKKISSSIVGQVEKEVEAVGSDINVEKELEQEIINEINKKASEQSQNQSQQSKQSLQKIEKQNRDDLNARKNNQNTSNQRQRKSIIGELEASKDPVGDLSSKSATDLNKIIKLVPGLESQLLKNKKIVKTKANKISFSAKNKKQIADIINAKLNPTKPTESSFPVGKYEGDPSKLKKAEDMSTEDMISLVGDGLTVEDITESNASQSQRTEKDVDDRKEFVENRTTRFDEIMSGNENLEGNDIIDEINNVISQEKPQSSQLEREFKELSPLAKIIIADNKMNTEGMERQLRVGLYGAEDIGGFDFEQSLGELFKQSLPEGSMTDSEIEHHVGKIIQVINRKYGSLANFLQKVNSFKEQYQKAPEDTQNHFSNAAKEIIKGLGSMLASEESLNRFSMNPMPSPDWVKASQHFENAWIEFKKGYQDLGLSERQLFKRFYRGVLNQLKKMKINMTNPKLVTDWFTKWAKGHQIGSTTNLNNRRFYTAGIDLQGVGANLNNQMTADLKQLAIDYVDMVEYQNEEGLSNNLPDTEDDKKGMVKVAEEGEVKIGISFKNIVEQISGQRLTPKDYYDIRTELLYRSKSWQKDSEGAYINEMTGKEMSIDEYLSEYLPSKFNIEDGSLGMEATNLLIRYHNLTMAQMPRNDRIEFNLINIEVNDEGKEIITDLDDKKLHRKKDINYVTGKPETPYVVEKMIEAQLNYNKDGKKIGPRVATISVNSVLNAWSRKKYRKTKDGAYQSDNPNELDHHKLYAAVDGLYSFTQEGLEQLGLELATNFKRFEGVNYPSFLVASKGGRAKSIIIGIADEADAYIGRNEDATNAFFLLETQKGRITEKQADGLAKDVNTARAEHPNAAVAIVGRYRFIQKAHGNKSMHSGVDELTGKPIGYTLKDHFKRFSNEFADGVPPYGIDDISSMHFDYTEVYAVSNITGKTIPLMNDKGKYIWDGIKLTSSSFMDKVSVALGRTQSRADNNPGWVKSFDRKMSSDNENYVQVKGLNALAPQDITIYRYSNEQKTISPNDEVVATLARDGNQIRIIDKDGLELDQLFSNEETKMSQGEYSIPYKRFEFEPSETRILQYANYFSKGAGTSPFQWFDQLQDLVNVNPNLLPLFETLVNQVQKDQRGYYRFLKSFRDNPATLRKWLESLESDMTIEKSEMMKVIEILDADSAGWLKHSHNSQPIIEMIKNRFIVDGAFTGRVKSRKATEASDGQSADYSHVVPDYHGIVKENEFGATPLHPAWDEITKMYLIAVSGQEKENWSKLGKTPEGRREQVDIINTYINTPSYKRKQKSGWFQFFRSPIQHFTNPHMLRVAWFSYADYGDVVYMHPSMMVKLEQDFDGDAVTGRKWPEDVQKALIDIQWNYDANNNTYEYTDEYNLLSYEIPLEAFKPEMKAYTPTNGQIYKEISANFETGAEVAMVQNARTVRSNLNHKGFSISFKGGFEGVRTLLPRPIDEVVVMDYAELDDSYTEDNLQNGDSIVEIDGKRYLQTSSDRELAILQQASFDESKLAFLAQWWKGIGGMDSGIGEITNLTNFIRSRTFKVVDANGSEVLTGDKQTQRLIKEAVDLFKVSSLRQGRDSNHEYMGMDSLNRASKEIYDRINSSVEEQRDILKSIKLPIYKPSSLTQALMQAGRKDVTPLEIVESTLNGKNTYVEETVSMPYELMVSLGLEDLNVTPNFLQPNKNQQANAIYMASKDIMGGMESDGKKLLRLVDERNISDNDISVGLELASRMNREYMMMAQQISEGNKLIGETAFSTAKIQYDDAQTAFIEKYIDEWNNLSDGAQFIATLSYFSGTSTMDSMIPANRILDFTQRKIEFSSTQTALRENNLRIKKEFKFYSDILNALDDSLKEEGEFGLTRTKRGLSGKDFSSDREYQSFLENKKKLDYLYDVLVNLKQNIDNLKSTIERESRDMQEYSKSIRWNTSTRMDRRRAITHLLPADLTSKDFIQLLGKKWIEMLGDAPVSTPLSGKQIKLATFQDLGYKKLEKEGNCKV